MRELKNRRHEIEKTENVDKIIEQPKSLLEAFENIVVLAEKSNLSESFYQQAQPSIDYARQILGFTPQQIVILALFVDNSTDSRINLSQLAGYLNCRTTRILRLIDDVDFLEKKHYIRASRGRRSVTYRVPEEVVSTLCKDQPYVLFNEPIEDVFSFFLRFKKLKGEKENDELTYENFKEHVAECLDEIKDTHFAKMINNYNLDDDDRMLFLFMTYLFVENDDDRIGFHDIEDLYDNEEIPHWCRRQLRNGDSDLLGKKLIEYVNEDGMARNDAYKLTQHTKEELLEELHINHVGSSKKGLISYDSLNEKQLFFNADEEASIAELTEILSEERFQGVQARLRKAGMRSGFCCLFYGSPGTGKTETVYQLARKTGRDIMKVDVDKIKSCWVGESEKNIKKLFDRYRSICNTSSKAPILLFNEADAVLGVRMEGASKAVDKMENSIQNIILQEMESLDGIMIATTNLTTNLDKAFERRFLYKIRYERPSIKSRAKIWQIMMPGMTDEDALKLSEKFDMSGGEIENIARKHTVNAILTGDESIDVAKISELCRTERINNKTNKLGF